MERYVELLEREIGASARLNKAPLGSVFFGGGEHSSVTLLSSAPCSFYARSTTHLPALPPPLLPLQARPRCWRCRCWSVRWRRSTAALGWRRARRSRSRQTRAPLMPPGCAAT